MGYVRFASQFRSVGPDGTTIYAGVGYTPEPVEVTNNETSATLNAGEAARFDGTRDNATAATLQCTIPRTERVAAGGTTPTDIPQTEVFGILRVSAVANVAFVGVALKDIPFGKTAPIAPSGAIVCVQSLASASLTSNVVGTKVIGSATAGKVNSTTSNAAGSATALVAAGTVLGTVLRIAGTGTTATGSDTQLGVLVAPW